MTLPVPDSAWFRNSGGIHGVSHTLRVLRHAERLSSALGLPGLEREAALVAALWHDVGRTHDGWDRRHGAKSAAKVARLGLGRGLDPELSRLAHFAVELHCLPDRAAPRAAARHPDPDLALRVLWVLKDADGLDRVRLEPWDGLDSKRLRFECSKEMVGEARRLLREGP